MCNCLLARCDAHTLSLRTREDGSVRHNQECCAWRPHGRARIIVQGHWQGVIGTFIRDDDGPCSPILDGLYELYPWMKKNGWESDTSSDPWGAKYAVS